MEIERGMYEHMKQNNRIQSECDKLRQIEMVRRKYPHFDPERDYILWIIADLYHPACPPRTLRRDGQVHIKTRSGATRIEPQITRTPYPNKSILQASGKKGRRCLYGIPILFSSIEELQDVVEIQIHWDLYIPAWYPWYQNQSMEQLTTEHCMIRYVVEFAFEEQHPEYRWFTIYSRDRIPVMTEPDLGLPPDYRLEFDRMAILSGSCTIDAFDSVDRPTVQAINQIQNQERRQQQNRTIDDNQRFLELLNWKQDDAYIRNLLVDAMNKREIQWHGFLYERTETIQARSACDFMVVAAFGFKDHRYYETSQLHGIL